MTYEEALRFIHTRRHGGPDLGRMRRVLDRLGSPDRRVPFVHVAGTNGKGSVCAFIEGILRAAGYKTGLFTSPYVTRFNERIRVNGMDIPDEDLVRTLERVIPVLEELQADPAEFELVTILGLTYFAEIGCDIAVLEVGMGGRNDATNCIEKSEVSVFTSIGLDHTSYLGNTPEEIASVKAGIVKPQGRAVAYMDPGGVIATRCREQGAELHVMDFSDLRVKSRGLEGQSFDYREFENLKIGLAGTYQPKNAALAVEAARILQARGWKIGEEHIRAGLRETYWGGRFEAVLKKPVFIIDGGHNPPAVEATAGSLRAFFPEKRFIFLTGVMADKDVGGILDTLIPLAERIICVAPPVPRALPAEKYAALIREKGGAAQAAATMEEAVDLALRYAGEDGIICALGSLYILEDARRAALSAAERDGLVKNAH